MDDVNTFQSIPIPFFYSIPFFQLNQFQFLLKSSNSHTKLHAIEQNCIRHNWIDPCLERILQITAICTND